MIIKMYQNMPRMCTNDIERNFEILKISFFFDFFMKKYTLSYDLDGPWLPGLLEKSSNLPFSELRRSCGTIRSIDSVAMMPTGW